MLKEKSMIALENNEGTNQPTPFPLHKKLDARNFEKHEEGKNYDEETRVDTPMELEKGFKSLEDEEPKEKSIIEIHIEKHCDMNIQDATYL